MISEVLKLTARRAAPAMLVLAAALPSSAEAGSYHHWGCRTPTAVAAPADGWDGGTTPAAAIESSCSTGGTLGVKVGEGTGSQLARLTYSPGPGLVATAATIWRAASATQSTHLYYDFLVAASFLAGQYSSQFDSGNADAYEPFEYATGDTVLGATPPVGAFLGTTTNPLGAANKVAINPLRQDRPQAPLRLEATCYFWDGSNFGCAASYLLTAYDVLLRDDSAPVVGAVAGSLVNAAGKIDPAAGAVSGSRNVIVLGSDTGSGLSRATIEVDGKEVAAARNGTADAARCNPATSTSDGLRAYVVRQPCPLSGSATVVWDTTKVADGSHAVRVLLEDASGNTSVVTTGQVLVGNAVPFIPGPTPAPPGEENGKVKGGGTTDGTGTGHTDTGSLSLVFPATARPASSSKASLRRCKQPKYAAKHVMECRGRVAQSKYVTSWSATKTVDVAGRLTDPQGNPITGAAVKLTGLPDAVGASPQALGTVTTDASGAFATTVTRASGSQVIRAEWLARLADTQPGAATSATLTVKAATALTAPKRVPRRSRVRFSGALLGVGGLLEKVPVRLQVQDGSRWWTFATASTDATGKWTTTAKFANQPGVYTVRAKVDSATTYPFAAGGSLKHVRIHVR